ncbi:MAG: enoyl-CoA hydratase/isomerase family protein [Aquabacterium sp.]|uniref:enoyl-CoA hydratase/isomerase family protein n=1 Tax=Aquabacterium sp. TaxID=1872578 RepID=UPI002723DB61|nr:enoyl-CoA hydratase/isomerase family protein [Aquabacterium sp.]MDO9003970.1 enoyl-CoA hydratase/isomerase family protein [Aquabacterium sp.]
MSEDQGAVHCDLINEVALITLDRPRALNALSHAMVLRLQALLDEVDGNPSVRAVVMRGAGPKAFCAGGDVIALVHSVRDATALHQTFFIDEYKLDLRIHTFRKPVVAFMHGIVMGGGMGLAQGAALRLVTDHVRMAMPETRIGLIPDVGASFFFSKMPAPVAAYLALTGANINAADAIFCNLADARSRVNNPEELPSLLSDIAWPAQNDVDTIELLRKALAAETSATHIEGSRLAELCPLIYQHFDLASPIQAIVAALAESPNEWARATAQTLRSHSPLMMALTLAALRRGRHLSLPACFSMEYDLVQHAMSCGEFAEGVRAHLVDKDHTPSWTVPSMEALTDSVVASVLAAAVDQPIKPWLH